MRRSTRPIIAALTTVVSVIGLWTGAIVSSAFAWSATALIMGGNSHPLSIPQDTTEFITDYEVGTDTLDLIDFGYSSAGDLTFTTAGSGDVAIQLTPSRFIVFEGHTDVAAHRSRRLCLELCLTKKVWMARPVCAGLASRQDGVENAVSSRFRIRNREVAAAGFTGTCTQVP